MFETVLVANRGEIARRVIRTLRRLGVRSVAVHSDADAGMPFVREADVAVRLGPAPAADSYLRADRILDAAARTGAQAIHPGYGFLSENAAFARACAAAGVVFIGPPPEAMEAMGDKIRAKELAVAAGVPVVPGFTLEEARNGGGRDSYPLLVKAAAGGGGRGMRVVNAPEDLDAAMDAARREALAGFGDDTVFIERFLPRARHIEIQVLADAHDTVLYLGERECSLQRRHQKVVEEAPSPVVTPEVRRAMGEAAVALARRAGYTNAGTVEFIAHADDPAEHYFLEMNARLQVEHPVTELVTGLDLVELQLRVAAGEALALRQEDVRMDGHAVEVRVNAEDASRDFLPSSGRVLAYAEPPGARVDSAVEAGSEVGTSYDSLVAKVIVHGPDREGALARMDRALAGFVCLGVTTNTGFARGLLAREDVRAGELDTGLIARVGPAEPPVAPTEVAEAAALISLVLDAERAGDDPFARTDGWRMSGEPAWSRMRLSVDGGDPGEVAVRGRPGAAEVLRDGEPAAVSLARTGPQVFTVAGDGVRRAWSFAFDGAEMWLGSEGHTWRVRRASSEEGHEAHLHGDLRAPMPGQVLLVPGVVGAGVKAGDPIVVMESMKMELTIAAPVDGVLTALTVAVGDRVAVDQQLGHVEAGPALQESPE